MSKKLGIEKQGNVYAVINYEAQVEQFSKLLTKKEADIYKATGSLPFGVTTSTKYETVETFRTKQEAQRFIENGGKQKPEFGFGVFKSKAQYKLAKKVVSA